MIYLYRVTNLINGKSYIGQTAYLKSRWSDHRSGRDTRSLLALAINKYGVGNFNFEVLSILEKHMVDDAEIKAISVFSTLTPKGYNISKGGAGYRRHIWDVNNDTLLGTMTDEDISDHLSMSVNVIRNRRDDLNIPAYNPTDCLDLNLLGTMSDKDLGNKYNISNSTVSYIRRDLGIPVYESDSPRFLRELNIPEEDYYKYSDNRLSVLYGGTHQMIAARRKYLGIPKHDKRYGEIDYSSIDISMLGLVPDSKVSEIFNIGTSSVTSYRASLGIKSFEESNYIKVDEKLLGSMPDTEIAKLYNCNSGMITKRRNKLGIKAFKGLIGKKLPRVEIPNKDLENMDVLQLAKKYNCSPTTASSRKREAGIVSSTEKRKSSLDEGLLLIIDARELSKLWGYSIQTIKKWKKNGKVPK